MDMHEEDEMAIKGVFTIEVLQISVFCSRLLERSGRSLFILPSNHRNPDSQLR